MKRIVCGVAAAVAVLLSGPSVNGVKAEASTKARATTRTVQTVATRRITEAQYKLTIADLFGDDIVVNGRFEPEQREHLLLAIGSSMLSISASGFDQYFAIGRAISEQVLDDKRRSKFATCMPATVKGRDDACTAEFIRQHGRVLFRRPLTAQEVEPRVAVAAAGAEQAQDYYAGLKLALLSLVTAPQFLFRVETAETNAGSQNAARLDGYTKAARLSYLLWNTTPDEALLAAAASGDLHTRKGLEKQVDRLLASPRLEDGTRAFFADMLQLDLYESVTKDAMIYPKFSQAVAESAREQTLKTVVDQLLTRNADYRDLFTTRSVFIDRTLASIYQVPFIASDGWTTYEFPPESDQSGLLTQISFLGLFSHPGRSSPTKRGVAINEILLCQPTPLPPANVDFSIVNDTRNPNLRTVRSRLLAHSEDESCASCHKKSDPLGLALEHFDSLGQHRLQENGEPIDVSAKLGNKTFDGAAGLGATLRENPKVPACLVRNVYAYGVGRAPGKGDDAFLTQQQQTFGKQGYRLRALLREIVLAPEFFSFVVPKAADAPTPAKSTIAENPSESAAGAS